MTEGETPLVFDLRQQSANRVGIVRILRRVMALLLCLVSGLSVWFVAIALTQGVAGFQWVVLVVVLGCLSFLIGEFILVLWKTNPGAVGLSIRKEGLEFTWLSGKTETLPWTGINRGFVLHDDSGVKIIRAHSSSLWEVRRWNRPITCLSREAFDAIILAASHHGVIARELKLRAGPFRWMESRAVRFYTPRPGGRG